MQRLHPLPAPPLPASPPSGLKVVDDDFLHAGQHVRPRKTTPATAPILEVMPSPSTAPRVSAKSINHTDDPFDDDELTAGALPAGELDFGPRMQSLPRFVPLQTEVFVTGRDPWSVRSLADLFRNYLPEVSLSTALVTVCGILGGQIVHHFIHAIKMPWVAGAYLILHTLNLASLYFGAKTRPSMETKDSIRRMLVGCFLLCIPHIVASALLRATA